MPLNSCAGPSAVNPAGSAVVVTVTTGETVSITRRLSSVAAPLFVITILYVTGSPMPALGGKTVFTTTRFVNGGCTSISTALENLCSCVNSVLPAAYAVFDTVVGTQTNPTDPVIVNVKLIPIDMVSPLRDHS